MSSYVDQALQPFRERRFTYRSYGELLDQLANSDRFAVVPLRCYTDCHPKNRAVVGLRHDIDHDPEGALRMARMEHARGLRATYFLLHTAPYYAQVKPGFVRRSRSVLQRVRRLQDEFGHEIGFHNDLVSLQVIYDIDAVSYAGEELEWLRAQGLDIVGTAAHGSPHCERYGYDNRYLFEDIELNLAGRPNRTQVEIDGRSKHIPKTTLAELGFEYEAYHLEANRHVSDATFVDGERHHPADEDWGSMSTKDRVIVLTHPLNWGDTARERGSRQLRRFVATRMAWARERLGGG